MDKPDWLHANGSAIYNGRTVEVIRATFPYHGVRRWIIRPTPPAGLRSDAPFKARKFAVSEYRLDRPEDPRVVAREDWIRKYMGSFGEPPQLAAYRAREVTFDTLYHSAIKSAENLIAEVQHCPADAFEEA